MCRRVVWPQMEKLNVGLMDAPDLRHPSEGWESIQEFTGSLRCHGTAALALLIYLLFTWFALCFFILLYLLVLTVFICTLMGQIIFKKKVRVLSKLVRLNGILICAAIVAKQLCLNGFSPINCLYWVIKNPYIHIIAKIFIFTSDASETSNSSTSGRDKLIFFLMITSSTWSH